MSNTIDERVVEMRFDNQQFESNVQTSMNTVEQLKKSLNLDGAAKGFNELDKAASNVSFDSMAQSLSALEKRFSTFGIISMRVIQNLTDAAMNFVANTMSSVYNTIIEGGKNRAFNIENAHFMLQGMIADSKEVDAIMNDAMESVSDTAYGYGDAAKAASQFAASGLRSGQQMQTALKGVAGVSATLNANYEDISRIFTQVAGQGRLMGDQLLQLSGRGLNAAANLSDYFNKVQEGSVEASDSIKAAVAELSGGMKVTEGDIRQLVSKGKISFEVFAEAMGSTFGEHAKKANETINGVTANIRAAWSKIGAKFIGPLIEQNNPIIKMLGTVKDKINDINKNIDPLANAFTNTVLRLATFADGVIQKIDIVGVFEKINYAVEHFNELWLGKNKIWEKDFMGLNLKGDQLSGFEKLLTNVARKHGIAIDDMIKKEGSFGATLKKGWLTKDIFNEALKKIKKLGKGVDSETASTVKNLKTVREAALGVISGKYSNGLERIEKLTKAGFDADTVQKYVNAVYKATNGTWQYNDAILETVDSQFGNIEALADLSEEELKNAGFTKKEIKALKELKKAAKESGTPMNELIESFDHPGLLESFITALYSVGSAVKKAFGAIKNAWMSVFKLDGPGMLERLSAALFNFSKMVSQIGSGSFKTLTNVFKGLFSILKIFIGAVVMGAKLAFPVIKAILSVIIQVAGAVGNAVSEAIGIIQKSKTLSDVISYLSEKAQNAASRVKELVHEFKEWAKQCGIISTASDGVQKIVRKLGEAVRWLVDLIRNSTVLKTGFEFIKGVAGGIVNWFKTLIEEIMALPEKSPIKIFEVIGNHISDGIMSIKAYIESAIAKIDLEGLMDTFLNKIFEIVSNFKQKMLGLTESGKGILGGIGQGIFDFIEKIKETVGGFNWGGLIAILSGVGAIVGVKKILSLIKSVDVMGGLIASLSKLAKSMAKEREAKAFATRIGVVWTIAKSLVAVAAVIYILGKLKPEEFKQAMNALFGIGFIIMTILAVATLLTQKTQVINGINIKGFGLLGVVLSIMLLVKTLKDIDSMNIRDIPGTLIILSSIILALWGMSKLFDKVKMSKGAGISLLAMALGIKIFVGVIKDIANLDLNQIKYNIANFIVVFGLITGLFALTNLAGDNAAKAGLMFIGLGVALRLMASAIKIIGAMKPGQALRGLQVIRQLLISLSAIMVASKVLGENSAKAGLMFLGLSAALLALAISLRIIGTMSPRQAEQGVIAITILLSVFGMIMALSDLVGPDAYKTVLTLALVIGVLTMCVGALSMIDPGSLATATTALVALMAAFSAMTVVLGKIEVGDFKSKMLALVPAFTALLAIAGILIAMSMLNVQASLENAKALSLLLLSLSASVALLSSIKLDAFSGGNAAAGLAAFIGIIGTLTAALGAINELVGGAILTNIQQGIPILQSVGQAIGSFIGGIISGINPEATGELTQIGSGLSDFISNAQTFFDSVKSIGGDTIGNVKNLATAILTITGADLLDSIAGFIRGKASLSSFGASLSDLADGLVDFAGKIDGATFTKDKIDAATNLTKMLAALASDQIPRTGGVLQFLSGEVNISGFASNLGPLADGIKSYAETIDSATFTKDKINASTNLAKMLAALASDQIPMDGGLISFLVGGRNLTGFANALGPLAKGLKSYAAEIDGATFTEDKIKASERMMKMLAKISNMKINATGGLASKIFGGKSLDNFGKSMEGLAKGVVKFSDTISGSENLGNENIDKAIDVLNRVSTVKLDNSSAIEDLKRSLDTLGTSLIVYSKRMDSLNFDKMNQSMSFLTTLKSKTSGGFNTDGISSLTSSISGMGDSLKSSLSSVTNGASKDMSSAASSITSSFSKNLANGLKNVSIDVSPIISKISSSLKSKMSSLSGTGSLIVSNISKGITQSASKLVSILNPALIAMKLSVTVVARTFVSSGKNLVDSLTKGIKTNSGSISKALTSGLSGATARIKSYRGSFYSAGSYLVSGFVNGISDNISRAAAASARMAKASSDAAKSKLNENSPSKVFYEIGEFAGLGFVNALTDYTNVAYKAGALMSSSAKDGLAKSISKVSDLIQNGMDDDLTIRPVLDLSNVEAGAGRIGDILNSSGYSVDVPYHLDAAAAVVANRNMTSNRDVVSAINALKKNFDDVKPGNVYNLNGITYDDGSNIATAIEMLVHAAKMERRA